MSARDERRRLVDVSLDDALARGAPDQEHERAIAIYDLIQENSFGLPDRDDGPYKLRVAAQEGRLVLDVEPDQGGPGATHIVPLASLRTLLKDYLLICESYYAAIRTATPAQIEALDHSRRAAHDEASAVLAERLAGKIEIDKETARRLFTLVVALHAKV